MALLSGLEGRTGPLAEGALGGQRHGGGGRGRSGLGRGLLALGRSRLGRGPLGRRRRRGFSQWLARGSDRAGDPLWSAGAGGGRDGGLGCVRGFWGSVLGLLLRTVAWIQLELRLNSGDFIIRGTSGKSSWAQGNK